MSDQKEIDDILNELKYKLEEKEISPSPDKNEEAVASQGEKGKADVDFNTLIESYDTGDNQTENITERKSDDNGKPPMNKKKIIIIAVAIIAAIAIIVGVCVAVAGSKKEEPTTTTTTPTTTTTTQAPVKVVNPLTGSTDFNKAALGKRPVAIVVENSQPARPQWGIADGKNPPDIILEGEVEGGETRMLWFYADYTAVPDQIGPIRSARPPYIKFSELFDSIFIHWGQSSSKGNYIGANTVFQTDNVDHINQMAYSDDVGLFGRDKSRGVSSEHTGVLYGNKLPDAIKNSKFRTKVNENKLSKLAFNEEEKEVGSTQCSAFALTFSSRTRTRDWTYSADDKMYHCTDYATDVARKNLLVLYDNTQYVVKENYKGSGRSEVYCNYELAGGKGKLISLGTATDITWTVENGLLNIKDANGSTVKLNAGTTWIGYASSNNGGTDTVA